MAAVFHLDEAETDAAPCFWDFHVHQVSTRGRCAWRNTFLFLLIIDPLWHWHQVAHIVERQEKPPAQIQPARFFIRRFATLTAHESERDEFGTDVARAGKPSGSGGQPHGEAPAESFEFIQ